jgi:DNA-binding XRE family transcriptional regulator
MTAILTCDKRFIRETRAPTHNLWVVVWLGYNLGRLAERKGCRHFSSVHAKDCALPRYSSFARRLRNTRIKRGLSAAEVADLVGVSGVSIHFWETDRCRPRDHNLTVLCEVLKLPIRATRAMAAG